MEGERQPGRNNGIDMGKGRGGDVWREMGVYRKYVPTTALEESPQPWEAGFGSSCLGNFS